MVPPLSVVNTIPPLTMNIQNTVFSNTLDVAQSPNKDNIRKAIDKITEQLEFNVYEHVQLYAEKNCVNISVKPKSCHCCVDIEFNDTTATFNTNNGKEELQTLLYDLVAGK
jgi:hypothetical protein